MTLLFFLPQYFEYTSQKEIRFNSVTELCAEVLEGHTFINMKHCPHDSELKPPSIVWEFREVRRVISTTNHSLSADLLLQR